jgi:hypothetical protein
MPDGLNQIGIYLLVVSQFYEYIHSFFFYLNLVYLSTGVNWSVGIPELLVRNRSVGHVRNFRAQHAAVVVKYLVLVDLEIHFAIVNKRIAFLDYLIICYSKISIEQKIAEAVDFRK